MKSRFKAILIRKDNDKQAVEDVELTPGDLMDGDVTVAVSHSTVNYKDGLVLTGRSPVVRKFPMIPGIDLAGTVEESSHPDFKAGRQGRAERLWPFRGALRRLRRICARERRLARAVCPRSSPPAQAMAIGTAGYTAMLSVLALEDAHVAPAKGAVVVTGAAGGVGSVAVALLAKLGYRVIASTGTAGGGRISEISRRGRNHSARRTVRRTSHARQRALGRRGRQCRLQDARQRNRLDIIWRGGRGLRPGRRDSICRPAWRRSFFAAFRCWGSISFRCRDRVASRHGTGSRRISISASSPR